MEVQAHQNDTNFWVDDGQVPNRYLPKVMRGDISSVRRIRAADKGNLIGSELLFNAGLS